MFERQTVFILGAGASWHYCYPTGEALVHEVLKKARLMEEWLRPYVSDGFPDLSFLDYIREHPYSGTRAGDYLVKSILFDFQNLAQKLQQINPPVIDYFLGQNPSLRKVGAMMIAWVILEREKCHLSTNEPNCIINRYALDKNADLALCGDNWYRFILYKLASNCEKSSDLIHNKVDFITFNYDVSLDHALYKGLNNIEFFEEKDVSAFLNSKNFLHMYGSIRQNPFGELKILPEPLRGHPSQLYTNSPILNMAYQASKGIRPIDPFKDEDIVTRDKARELIAKTEDVYILGYGFDSNNNKRLDLYKGLRGGKDRPKKYVHFTNKDDKQVINKRASKVFFNHTREFYPGRPFVFEVTQLHQGEDIQGFMYEKSVGDVYSALQDDFDFL